MAHTTIDALRASLGKPQETEKDAAYAAKMMHEIPEAQSVDRVVFLLQQVAGKRVLEFGASGPMHDGIVKAASQVLGVDRIDADGVTGFDLDDVSLDGLPHTDQALRPHVIVCGEVLEHLANPGWFLQRLKKQYAGVPVVITVPNAHSRAGFKHAEKGCDNVNADHVSWYSWKTMTLLLGRYGYVVKEFYFYGGDGPTAEGLVFVCE